MDLYLENMLSYGYSEEAQKAALLADLVLYHLSYMLDKYLRSELIIVTEMVGR